MLEETPGVAGLPRPAPQRDLERRERARPTGQLDDRSPESAGQMEDGHSRPIQDPEGAGDDEDDEGEMKAENEIGEQAVRHFAQGRARVRLTAHPLSREMPSTARARPSLST